LLFHHGKFGDDEAEEPPADFASNLPGVLETLNEGERLVLTLRYLKSEPKSLAQIAQFTGVTKERMWQIEAKALQKLLHPANKRALGIKTEKKSRYLARGRGYEGLDLD